MGEAQTNVKHLVTVPESRTVGVGPHPRALPYHSFLPSMSCVEYSLLPLVAILLVFFQGLTVPARVSTASVKMWLPTSPGGMAVSLQTQTTST